MPAAPGPLSEMVLPTPVFSHIALQRSGVLSDHEYRQVPEKAATP